MSVLIYGLAAFGVLAIVGGFAAIIALMHMRHEAMRAYTQR